MPSCTEQFLHNAGMAKSSSEVGPSQRRQVSTRDWKNVGANAEDSFVNEGEPKGGVL